MTAYVWSTLKEKKYRNMSKELNSIGVQWQKTELSLEVDSVLC